MTEPVPVKGLHAKLAAIAAEQSWIPKTGKNSAQGYHFAEASSVLNAVRGEMATRGLTMVPSVRDYELTAPTGDRKSFMLLLKIAYTITDSESGESIVMEWAGQAMDPGDKALNKAYTAAQKYALMQLYMIPTGDDPEADGATDEDAKREHGRVDSRPETPPAGKTGAYATAKQQLFMAKLATQKLGAGPTGLAALNAINKHLGRSYQALSDITGRAAREMIDALLGLPDYTPETTMDEPTKTVMADSWGLEA